MSRKLLWIIPLLGVSIFGAKQFTYKIDIIDPAAGQLAIEVLRDDSEKAGTSTDGMKD